MATKKKSRRRNQKKYTYEEFINTFFPNRKEELKRVSRPDEQPKPGVAKTRT